MNARKLKFLLAAALGAGSLGAISAHAEGFYAGGSLGVPHYRDGINGIEGDGSGLSGKVYGGYAISPNFALEAGVADLGHVDTSAGTVKGHGEFVDAVGIAPLSDKWSLLGRVGLAHVNLDTSNGDSSGTGLKFGLGAQYSLTSNTSLRGEWERYRPDAFGAKPNIDQYTFGVRVAF
jgi:OmpA-OmpF porin, OOP family